MSNQDAQSPEYIEEQIEQTRHQLSETLEELQRRLSPGDIFEETLNYLRANKSFGRSLTTTVRENPVPICLMGIGLTWLMASGASGPRSQHRLGDPDMSHQAYGSGLEGEYSSGHDLSTSGNGKVKRKMTDAKSKASHAAESAKDKIQDAKSKVSTAAESTRDRLSSSGSGTHGQGGGKLHDRYQNVRHKSSQAAHNMREGYQQRTHQMRHQARTLLEERPLAAVAIGFGIGAALGLMLPATSRENRLMGNSRDRLRDRAMQEGQEQFERAREQVESAAEAAHDQVKKSAGASDSSAGSHRSSQPATESGSQPAGGRSTGAPTMQSSPTRQ